MMPAYIRDPKFLHATVVLVGTMVGAGIYGIPFAFAKAGFWVGTAWLIGLAAIVVLFNLMFAELALSTQGSHQVTGYVNIWLGPWARRIASCANVLSLYGALLAYIIVSGEFLHAILSNFIAIDPQLYSVVFAVAGALCWVLRIKTIAAVEGILIALYTGAVILIAVVGFSSIRIENYSGWTPDFWYLPYGIILFALAGMSAIPIQRRLLKGREKLIRPAILWAVGFVVCMYLLFACVVVGISGEVTSPSAFAGLYDFMGTPIILLGAILGVLTITTSYIMLGTALFETFHIDYRQRLPIAWLIALVPPLAFFLSGMRNFIDIIGLVGAVAVGVLCILLSMAYLRARLMRLRLPEVTTRLPTVVVWIFIVFFAAGVVVQLLVQ